MFVLFVIARAAVVPICNVKTTGETIVIVIIILSCVGEFILMLICLVTYFLGVNVFELLLSTNVPLSTWDMYIATLSDTMLFIWLPILSLGMLMLLFLVCLNESHVWVDWWIGWCYGYKVLCS